MALTQFQRDVCRTLADTRRRSGESDVAGGSALNEWLAGPRVSRDVDLFHDTEAALAASWLADRQALLQAGYRLTIVRERPTFVEAEVRRDADAVIVQWTRDSAYRFFPLVEHPRFWPDAASVRPRDQQGAGAGGPPRAEGCHRYAHL